MTAPSIIPRVIRLRDAPRYLGMDTHRFNAEVRPFVPEIRIGIQGVAFDRLDLDAWWEDYKETHMRYGRPRQTRGGEKWPTSKYRQGSKSVGRSGISTKKSVEDDDFNAALARVISKKR